MSAKTEDSMRRQTRTFFLKSNFRPAVKTLRDEDSRRPFLFPPNRRFGRFEEIKGILRLEVVLGLGFSQVLGSVITNQKILQK
jgi:hypothetical protein